MNLCPFLSLNYKGMQSDALSSLIGIFLILLCPKWVWQEGVVRLQRLLFNFLKPIYRKPFLVEII